MGAELLILIIRSCHSFHSKTGELWKTVYLCSLLFLPFSTINPFIGAIYHIQYHLVWFMSKMLFLINLRLFLVCLLFASTNADVRKQSIVHIFNHLCPYHVILMYELYVVWFKRYQIKEYTFCKLNNPYKSN